MPDGILAFDLSPSWCGWSFIGPGRKIEAGAFLIPPAGDDLGTLAAVLEQHFAVLVERFDPLQIGYEAPIMRKWDSLIDVRKIYGLGMALEYFALARELPCIEVDLKRVKMVMTDDPWAKKEDVAAAAVSLGVELPPLKAQGRLDAADAVGVALEVARLVDPHVAAPHLAKLRGNLL